MPNVCPDRTSFAAPLDTSHSRIVPSSMATAKSRLSWVTANLETFLKSSSILIKIGSPNIIVAALG